MLTTDVGVTKFKCPWCGLQMGVYIDKPNRKGPTYQLVASIWGGPWRLGNQCPKCQYYPLYSWLHALINNELDEADNLPF